jgi:hypothetical protein
MSTMSVNYTRVADPRWIRENIVIVRVRSAYGGADGFGSIECAACGCHPLTQRELADAIGVKLTQLTDFLHGRSNRPDVMAKITASVKEVRSA